MPAQPPQAASLQCEEDLLMLQQLLLPSGPRQLELSSMGADLMVYEGSLQGKALPILVDCGANENFISEGERESYTGRRGLRKPDRYA